MTTLDDLVHDLLDRYRGDDKNPGDGGAGLITRLDDLAKRTAQPRQVGGHSAPGSRPPASLGAVHWSVRIKSEAVVLDMELRGSNAQSWDRAMRAIPPGAESADRVRAAQSTVGAWHGTCLTVLGLRQQSSSSPCCSDSQTQPEARPAASNGRAPHPLQGAPGDRALHHLPPHPQPR